MNDEGKIPVKAVVIVVAAIALVIVAGYWGGPAYRHFKEKREAAEAQAFFDHGDFRNAFLSARQALLVNSNDISACRVMAGLADAARSPAALDWYQQLVKLSPTITNQLLLASAGLRYQSPPYPLTSQILEDVSASAAQVPDFHIVSAELALASHNITEAEAQFEAVCRLAPTNRLYQLNLAVIRLSSTNATADDDAREKLKRFSHDADLGPPALRSLIADRLLHDDASGALEYSTQLLAGTQPSLNDQLQHLGILKRLHHPELAGQLKALQVESTTNAQMAAQVASWMVANDFLTQATDWLNHMPVNLRSQTPVRLALADCYLSDKNWQALRDYTSKGSWEDLEFLRLAYLSRAWNKLDEPVMANGDWNSAISLAGNRLGALNELQELAGRWGMKAEQEDLLWRILQRFPDATWAELELERNYPGDLQRRYLASGNTRGLYQLYSENLSRSPQILDLKNNLTFTALLLKTNLEQAFQWAADDYAQKTNDPTTASTYAYALHLQGRNQDGLAVLQKLSRAELEEPSVALYYGVLLSGTGKTNEAKSFLQVAQTKGRLLPEEKRLLAETLK